MEINRLVINGCSYLVQYVRGGGHYDLAEQLLPPNSEVVSLCMAGGSNSRIVRTTLEDCYNSTIPTLYVIGVTFMHRFELPILKVDHKQEKYIGFTDNFKHPTTYKPFNDGVTINDVKKFNELQLKFNISAEREMIINLVYSLTSLVDSIVRSGHSVVVFNTGEIAFKRYETCNAIQYVSRYKQIVKKLHWYSNEYQFCHGARVDPQDISRNMELICKHVAEGEHSILNNFLTHYIKNNDLLM